MSRTARGRKRKAVGEPLDILGAPKNEVDRQVKRLAEQQATYEQVPLTAAFPTPSEPLEQSSAPISIMDDFDSTPMSNALPPVSTFPLCLAHGLEICPICDSPPAPDSTASTVVYEDDDVVMTDSAEPSQAQPFPSTQEMEDIAAAATLAQLDDALPNCPGAPKKEKKRRHYYYFKQLRLDQTRNALTWLVREFPLASNRLILLLESISRDLTGLPKGSNELSLAFKQLELILTPVINSDLMEQ